MILLWNTNYWIMKCTSFCYLYLRLDYINTSNHFCNRMFYLDTWIYFNKVKIITCY